MTDETWWRTACCSMFITHDSPAFASGELEVVHLHARHADPKWCQVFRPHDETYLPVCYTCDDTGLMLRRDGSSSLCPSHCDAAWARLEGELQGES